MKPRTLSVVLVLLALLLTAPAAQATRTSPHLGALTAAELPPPLPSRSVLAAGPTPALPLLSPKDRAISAALASLDEPERARLLGLRRFRLTTAAAPLSRLEPLVWGQKTASGRFFAPGAPNLWETRLFNPASRQGDLFLEPDPLGPVDSPNLYQAFGFDGLNVRDPFGECKWNDWECWGWVAKDFARKTGHDLWNVASLGTLERVERQKNLGTLGGVAESAFQGARSVSNAASLGLQESIFQTQMREGPGVKSILKGTGKGFVALTPYEEGKTLITDWSSLDAAQRWRLGLTAFSKTAGLAAGATALGERAFSAMSMDEFTTAAQEGMQLFGREMRTTAVVMGREATTTASGFSSFSKLKRALGPAGEGKQWHHIVEQSKVPQFGAEAIHNPDNVVAIPTEVHRRISGYYSSKQGFTEGQRVREWLNGQSFGEQQKFGLEVLRDFGVGE